MTATTDNERNNGDTDERRDVAGGQGGVEGGRGRHAVTAQDGQTSTPAVQGAGAPESGGSGATVLALRNIHNNSKAGADMGMIIHADELLEHETFVELVLTTDEIETTIDALRGLSIDESQREPLASAVASMNFALQRAKTATWRRQLAEELLDRARAAR